MKIAEIFYSIQGEGTLVGVPSVFVRTSGCNLRCEWCDTPYTSWRPEGTDWTLDRIVAEVRSHAARHVVVTGGDVLLTVLVSSVSLAEVAMFVTLPRNDYEPDICFFASSCPG